MYENNFKLTLFENLKKLDKPKFVFYISLLFVISIITFSFTGAVCFLISYALGALLVYLIFKFKCRILQIVFKSIVRYEDSHFTADTNQVFNKPCNICENEKCVRHLANNQEPWINLHVHKQFDQAVENFYNIIIKKFVIPWYCKLTKEDTLLVEIRFLLRYASSSLLNRFLKVNVGQLIINKLVPCALRHFALCSEAKRLLEIEGFEDLESAALHGPLKYSMHPALANRKKELHYLKCISEAIMPLLLPKKHMNSKLFKILIQDIFSGWVLLSLTDVLADPNIINTLVILATGDKKMSKLPEFPNHQVEFLQQFVKNNYYKQMRLLNLDVSEMLKNPEYLYAFMQFMKSEGKIHLLQCCLDIDEFNKKMLQPELNKNEKESLFKYARELFDNYFSNKSSSYISFEKEYVEQFKNILNGGPINIAKLQTSKVIYEAYDHVFSLLDKEWAPKFFDSEEFYNLIIPNVIIESKKISSNNSIQKSESNKKPESPIVKPLSKLKDAFKTPAIDGQFVDFPIDNDISDNVDIEMQYSDILANYASLKNKDMSTWKVSIEEVVEKKASNKSGILEWFVITINKIDPHGMGDDSQWFVERTDHDIYVLKEKLIEFHGESALGDFIIPPKRLKTTISVRKKKYETFLQHLLLIPLLRCSHLLHMFLTADADFTILAEQAKSDSSNFLDFGSIYQTVTHKLRKERGQHLDAFLQAFLISTDVEYYQSLNEEKKGKDSECDEEATDVLNDITYSSPDISTFNRRLTQSVFKNNFNLKNSTNNSSLLTKENENWKFTQCSLFMLSEVFKVHSFMYNIVSAIFQYSENNVNEYFEKLLYSVLCKVLSPPRLGYLIKLGQDLIFEDILPSTMKLDRNKKMDIARSQLQTCFPLFFTVLMGPNFLKGVDSLFEFLQCPNLNKQLIYNMFDMILLELFPEIENKIK